MRLSVTWTAGDAQHGMQVHDDRLVYVLRDTAGRPTTREIPAGSLATVDYSTVGDRPVITLNEHDGTSTSFPCPRKIARVLYPAIKWLTV
ncbi:hypothetical protein [Frigoribacterium sp. RIT-PI-h]|uniref:hypothetical protein n=1 Tax=Frigoribacterium sp. RIT-PI-h TaxID=1690245 RepID=UPI000AE02DA4|nr:hypothetical protein [Frigoribacterium sp. RIT-PI-h]